MKKVLYLGTSPTFFSDGKKQILHYPVIRLIPKSCDDERVRFCLSRLDLFSHHLFTSKNSVEILWDLCDQLSINPAEYLRSKCVSIGDSTSHALRVKGIEPFLQAKDATQEGMIVSLALELSPDSYVFYPRSSLARPALSNYLEERKIPHESLDLYDTIYQKPLPLPLLDQIEEIVFSSPSTVDGFFKIFDTIPDGIKVSFQGPITQRHFLEKMESELINLFAKS